MFYGLMPLTLSTESHLLKYATVFVTFDPKKRPTLSPADCHFLEIQFYVETFSLALICQSERGELIWENVQTMRVIKIDPK